MPSVTRSSRRTLIALSLVAIVAVLATVGGGVWTGLLSTLPALLLALPLFSDGGEQRIARLARCRSRGDRRKAAAAVGLLQAAPWPLRALPRGARLIAFSLAERPPPASLLAR